MDQDWVCEVSVVFSDLSTNAGPIKDPHDLVMVAIGTANISDASILIEVSSEAIASIEVGTVAQ